MTSIFLRDGKVLVASDGRGLSQDCGCCDKPPPPPPGGCDTCCAGTQTVGDSVLIAIDCVVPSVAVQVFSPSPSDNGVRVVPATTMAGDGVVFVQVVDELQDLFSRINVRCVGAHRTTSWEYGNATLQEYIDVNIDFAHPLQPNGTWSPTTPEACEASGYINPVTSVVDLKPTGGSDAVLELETDPDTGSGTISYALFANPLSLQDLGPCAGSPIILPIYYGIAYTSFGTVISQPDNGEEVGTLTINDVE